MQLSVTSVTYVILMDALMFDCRDAGPVRWAFTLDRGHPDHWIVKIHRTGVPVEDVEVLA